MSPRRERRDVSEALTVLIAAAREAEAAVEATVVDEGTERLELERLADALDEALNEVRAAAVAVNLRAELLKRRQFDGAGS